MLYDLDGKEKDKRKNKSLQRLKFGRKEEGKSRCQREPIGDIHLYGFIVSLHGVLGARVWLLCESVRGGDLYVYIYI